MKILDPPLQEKIKPGAKRIIHPDTPDIKSSKIAIQEKKNSNLFGEAIQREEEDEFQMKKQPIQRSAISDTGIPENVQAKMEGAFNRSFDGVKVHSNSSKAVEAGALAYTQGSNIHFAPGQYNPSSSSGQKLLGHELAHVVQQSEGRVKPISEVAGMPLNDSPTLEKEADLLGDKASKY